MFWACPNGCDFVAMATSILHVMVVVCEYDLCLLYFVIPQGLRKTEIGTKDTKSDKSKYISPAVASE